MKNLVLILVCLIATTAYSQNNEVQVNPVSTYKGVIYPNEPSLCISKTNPTAIVAGANIAYHYFSSDNGRTWEDKMLKTPYGVWGDPVLHSDIDGNIYFVHLSRTAGKSSHYGFIDRIVVQTSADDGKTFSEGSYTGLNGSKMQDKPWISTDDYSTKWKGNAYLTWTEFDKINSKKKKYHSRIRFSASSNIGKNWTEAITISDSVGDCVDDDHTLEGATTAVGVNGEIYCAWAGHHKLFFDKSLDGGKTWGKDKVMFDQVSGWSMDIPHLYRSNGLPFLVVDNSSGKYTGRLYLVWGEDKGSDADVLISYSDDGGTNWSTPKRVHNDLIGKGKSQYLPNVAIDQTTGHIAIAYYDRRNSEHNVFSDVYTSISRDGSATFDEYRMNNLISSHAGKNVFSGDYIDVDFHAGKLSVIWSAYDESSNVYNRTLLESELDGLYPIHDVGQVQHHVAYEKRKPVLYIACTRPSDVQVTYYRKSWFSKNPKEKRTEVYNINHRPGLQGISELRVQSTQKRRIKIVITPTERDMYPDDIDVIEIP